MVCVQWTMEENLDPLLTVTSTGKLNSTRESSQPQKVKVLKGNFKRGARSEGTMETKRAIQNAKESLLKLLGVIGGFSLHTIGVIANEQSCQ